MSEIKVNKVSPRSGTTVTLGDSGDTFTIPSGAIINNQGTAVNFGATGSASWVTTVKTSGFTAVAGEGYFVNTTGGAVSVHLPAGTAGAVVAFKDYANTFDTNALTLVQNGSDKIGGSTVNADLRTEGIAVTLVFIDSTQGWLVTDSGLQSESPTAEYITATGGTITTSGDYKIHTFTGPGTLGVTNAGNSSGSNTVDYLVIAGGGGGAQSPNLGRVPGAGPGSANCSSNGGGGGGAGGYRFSDGTASGCYSAGPSPLGASALPVSVSCIPITVGGGGNCSAGPYGPYSGNGSNSVFSTITSTGGGGGGGGPDTQQTKPGGSGGGAGAASNPNLPLAGGSGNTPPVSPPQGNPGGTTNPSNVVSANGGGGAGGAASNVAGGNCTQGTQGGVGLASSITGSPVSRGGGGSGGSGRQLGGRPSIGFGGGASGCYANPGSAGTVNTGGGGGGAAHCSGYPSGPHPISSGAGGSGIVIIRYKFQN